MSSASTEDWDQEACAFYLKNKDAFGWDRLRYIRTVQESKALNDLRVSFIVISASGMCEAGRILHHLKNGIEDPRNLILITGYQAAKRSAGSSSTDCRKSTSLASRYDCALRSPQ
jgi:metallo-beta-lactamase family protein